MAGYRRAPIKKRGPVEQVVHDFQVGVPNLIEQGKKVFTKVTEGGKKVLNFLNRK